MSTTVITFDNQGQDFLHWVLDERGVVVKSLPFNEGTWRGTRVLDFQNLTEGSLVSVVLNGAVKTVRYPLIRIKTEAAHG